MMDRSDVERVQCTKNEESCGDLESGGFVTERYPCSRFRAFAKTFCYFTLHPLSCSNTNPSRTLFYPPSTLLSTSRRIDNPMKESSSSRHRASPKKTASPQDPTPTANLRSKPQPQGSKQNKTTIPSPKTRLLKGTAEFTQVNNTIGTPTPTF